MNVGNAVPNKFKEFVFNITLFPIPWEDKNVYCFNTSYSDLIIFQVNPGFQSKERVTHNST